MTSLLQELLPGSNYGTQIVIEKSLTEKAGVLIEHIGFAGKKLLIVCDENTYAAFGDSFYNALDAKVFLLKGKPHADLKTVNLINEQEADALIAVGSGTINDLCKYASYVAKKEYAVFPTAPSMNGYFSANASITTEGHKQSLKAYLPKGIFCDLNVLAAAPKRLIRSGLGDSLCRSTAQADWLLSHLLFETPYDPLPFTLLAPYEKELLASADKLVEGDVSIIELLVKTLIVSGLGMVMAGGSYPASQGEHLIAHTMEMMHSEELPESYHGEQIGVTTLIMAEIQEDILSRPLHLEKTSDYKTKVENYFGESLTKSVSREYSSKYQLQEKYDTLNEKLKTEWPAICDAINAIRLPTDILHEALQKAGAPTTTAELGWSPKDLYFAVAHAHFMRDRFTFLDLL